MDNEAAHRLVAVLTTLGATDGLVDVLVELGLVTRVDGKLKWQRSRYTDARIRIYSPACTGDEWHVAWVDSWEQAGLICDAHNGTLGSDAKPEPGKPSILDEKWEQHAGGVYCGADGHHINYHKWKRELSAAPDAYRALVEVQAQKLRDGRANPAIDAALKKAGIE